MKIKTALILCAGYGKRLNPITLTTPKPLLKINETTLLENCINLIRSLGINKILINTFYLSEKIEEFIKDKKFKDKIYNYFLKLNKKKLNEAILLSDFEILSILRNMKIIGIFTRLAMRDKKKQYLKLIPYAWKLIELRISNNMKFSELKSLLDLNFSKKVRNQK